MLAAASHSLAGGEISAIAVLVTAIIALPLCVALAGRVGSTWRVALAVTASQFLYHWAFAGIGVAGSLPAEDTAFPAGSHAAHLASLERFVPVVVEAGTADAIMWILHGLAAVVSTVLIAKGERAIIALGRTLSRALPRHIVRTEIRVPRAIRVTGPAPRLRQQRFLRSSCTLRGPPRAAF